MHVRSELVPMKINKLIMGMYGSCLLSNLKIEAKQFNVTLTYDDMELAPFNTQCQLKKPGLTTSSRSFRSVHRRRSYILDRGRHCISKFTNMPQLLNTIEVSPRFV